MLRGLGCSPRWRLQLPNLVALRHVLVTWNVTSLGGLEPELFILTGNSTTNSIGSRNQLLETFWTLFYSEVARGKREIVRVGLVG